ncbi:MAG: TIGR04219 family outer membrane beta-barrel protein [Marinicella sp.]
MKKMLLSGLMLTTSLTVMADVLGFSVGANYWQYDMDGTVRSPIATNNQVGINFDDAGVNFFATFEHPVPFLPNVRLQQNNIQAAGLISVSDASFQNGELVYVSGDIDLSHTDVTMYYEILDNWVNLDLGLTAKYFTGYSRFQYTALIDDESDFDDWIPMVYAKAQFDLPLTGFSAAATVGALSFDNNHVTDVDLALKYQSELGFGADLGYRTMDVDLRNINSFKSDLTVDGFYLGGRFEF